MDVPAHTTHPRIEPPAAPADGAGLTTGAVARMLGVAPTTVRSWDRRYGLGPAAREGGRHRRWTSADIAVLEHMCRLTASGVPPAEAARQARAATRAEPRDGGAAVLPAAVSTPGPARHPEPARYAEPARHPEPAEGEQPGGRGALPLGSVSPECRGLARAAVRLDAPAVDGILSAAAAEHGLLTCWDEVIMPAMRAVGRKWATSGERYVEVEHLLSWHVSSLLRRLATVRQPPAGPPTQRPLEPSAPVRVRPARSRPPAPPRSAPVLLACMPGEMHTLPLEAVVAGLAERGLPMLMFGAAVPAEALNEAVRRTGPAAVVLWSQSRATADRTLVRQLGALAWGVRGARLRPAVLVAGPGWAGGGRLPGAVRPRGLREALDTLAAVCAR